MSDPLGTVLVQPIEQGAPSRAAQNLFEHIAGNLQSLPAQAGPGSLGRRWAGDLQGLVERLNRKRVLSQAVLDDLGEAQAFTSSEVAVAHTGTATNTPGQTVAGPDFKRLLGALQATQDANLGIMLVAGTAKRVSDGIQMLVKG